MLEDIVVNEDGSFTAIVPPTPQTFKLEDIQDQIFNLKSQIGALQLDIDTYNQKQQATLADLNTQLADLESVATQLSTVKNAKPLAKIQ